MVRGTFLRGTCLLSVVALMPFLSGCSIIREARLTPKVDRANAQMAAAKIDCDAKYPPVRGNYLNHARCVNAAQNWTIRPLFPYPDILAQAQTGREILAARVDAGDLSPAQMNRMIVPEDLQLTTDNATLNGPLTRWIPPAYYAPPEVPTITGCSSGYGFADCHN